MNEKENLKNKAVASEEKIDETQANKEDRSVRVRFDDKSMVSNYANVANVGMSKDEVTLLFGTNQTWGSVENEVVVQLSSRIIMTPSVAKNLVETLQRVLQEYEQKIGQIA